MSKTVIHKDNTPYFGDSELLSIAPAKNFSEMIFEMLSGFSPNKNEAKIFETILNISIDHGPDTPSAIETLKSKSEGKTISESVAHGLMQINDVHGGAIEPAMELFYKIKKNNIDISLFVKQSLEVGERISGFGHRIYEEDPRAQLLFKLMVEMGMSLEFVDIAKEVDKELKIQKGKPIPVNIDGAIASVLCTFGWPKELGKAVFIVARTPGLCGQYLSN